MERPLPASGTETESKGNSKNVERGGTMDWYERGRGLRREVEGVGLGEGARREIGHEREKIS